MADGLAGRFGISWEAARVASSYADKGSVKAVVERTGFSQKKVKSYLTDSRVQAAIEAELKRKMNQGSAMALETIRELTANAKDERVRLQAAKDWLDRAGYKPEHMHQSADKQVEADAGELQRRIVQMFKDLGMDPKALGFDMKVIEGETAPSTKDTQNGGPAEESDD